MSYKNNKFWVVIALSVVLILIFSTVAQAAVLRGSKTGALKSTLKSSSLKASKTTLTQVVQSSTNKIKKSSKISSLGSSSSTSSTSSNFKASKTSKSKLKKASSSTSSTSGSSSSSRGDQVTMTASKFSELEQRMESGEKRIIVQNPTDSQITDLVQNKGCLQVHGFSDWASFSCDDGVADNLIQSGLVEEAKVYHLLDSASNAQIHANEVQVQGYDGEGVTVAVLDSGIDTDNVELVGNIAGGQGFGFPTYEDDHGHGTSVASVIAGKGISHGVMGVAPKTKIYAAKVCGSNNRCKVDDIMAALNYIRDTHVADVVSMSIGTDDSFITVENCDSLGISTVINNVVNAGIPVVVGSGNNDNGPDQVGVNDLSCSKGAISVGAVDSNNNRASFSKYGPALDLMAPGTGINVIFNNNAYGTGFGTSYSTPHVAGVIALLLDAKPSLSVDEIKNALYSTATDLGSQGKDNEYGYGIVNAYAAFLYVTTLPQTPQITADPLSEAEVGLNYNFDIKIRGGKSPYDVKIRNGSLPGGLSINNFGVISGVPTSKGESFFTVQVSDSNNDLASKSFNLKIYEQIKINEATFKPKYGKFFRNTLDVTGGKMPFRFEVSSGHLPSGLNISLQAGEISGIADECGKIKPRIKVLDSLGAESESQIIFKVKSCPLASALTYEADAETESIGDYYLEPTED